jgi:hypothetical protein
MPPDNYFHNARTIESLLPEILALWIFILSYRFGRLAENLSFCNLLELYDPLIEVMKPII